MTNKKSEIGWWSIAFMSYLSMCRSLYHTDVKLVSCCSLCVSGGIYVSLVGLCDQSVDVWSIRVIELAFWSHWHLADDAAIFTFIIFCVNNDMNLLYLRLNHTSMNASICTRSPCPGVAIYTAIWIMYSRMIIQHRTNESWLYHSSGNIKSTAWCCWHDTKANRGHVFY
jgi:hypothetical protein